MTVEVNALQNSYFATLNINRAKQTLSNFVSIQYIGQSFYIDLSLFDF